MGILKEFIQKTKHDFPHLFTRQWLLERGLMFSAMILGMLLSYPLQFFAPLPKEGWLFLQQSFGFGLLYGGLGAFMMITCVSWCKDISQRSRQTLKSDKALFLGVLLSFLFIYVMIDTYGVQNPVLKYTGALTWFIAITFNKFSKPKNDGSSNSGEGGITSVKLKSTLKSSEFIVR